MTKRRYPDLTDAEEAEIQRQIAADPDDAGLTEEQASQRMTFAEACPDLAASIQRARSKTDQRSGEAEQPERSQHTERG